MSELWKIISQIINSFRATIRRSGAVGDQETGSVISGTSVSHEEKESRKHDQTRNPLTTSIVTPASVKVEYVQYPDESGFGSGIGIGVNVVTKESEDQMKPASEVFPTEKITKQSAKTIQLSKNFSLYELIESNVAERLGIDNIPDSEQLGALRRLCVNVLQPARDFHGPIRITSGLRVLALNRAVKSKDTSQHRKGQAADIECYSTKVSNYELAKWISQHTDFDQLILEYYDDSDPHSGWVHVSYNSPVDNRKQILVALKEDIDGDGDLETVYKSYSFT